MRERLDSRTLGLLDGGTAGAIIDAAIEEAVRDCEDRGQDGKARLVEVRLELTRGDSGVLVAHVEACAKVPRRRTAGTLARPRLQPDGRVGLLFQPHSPDNPDQRTLDEASGELRDA